MDSLIAGSMVLCGVVGLILALTGVGDAIVALEAHFGQDGGRQLSALALARFAAAMQELRDARAAFDVVVSGSPQLRCWLTAPG
ncbi:hypothetical protein SAMN05446635_9985 [Burkholderia sp. OK233]|nr:hypothetical protein SAMN05446635_9985 [Burkholderia sp. OK233]